MEAIQYVGLRKSCTLCTQQHVACNGLQPCQRCIEWNKGAQCEFLLSRKRGRPQKRPTNSSLVAGSTSTSSKRHQPQPPTSAAPQPASKHLPPEAARTSTHLLAGAVGHHSQTPMLQPRARGYIAPSRPTTTTTATTAPALRSHTMANALAVHQQQQQDAGLPTSLLTMLVEQMRDLRKENRLLLDRVTSLQNQQTVFEQQMDAVREGAQANAAWMLDQLARRHESITLHARMSQDMFSQPIEPHFASRWAALTRIMPFLTHYDLPQELIIDDLSKPFAAFSVRVTPQGELLALYTYTSPSYDEFVGCEPGELLGSRVTTFCHPEDNVTRETILFYVAQPPPRSRVGPIFHTSPAGISKDRRVLRFHSRHQYFFTTTGRCAWCVSVVDQVLSRGYDMPRYTGPRDSRILPSPWPFEEEESSPEPIGSSGWTADNNTTTNTTNTSDQRLDSELDELLSTLSAPSPAAQ